MMLKRKVLQMVRGGHARRLSAAAATCASCRRRFKPTQKEVQNFVAGNQLKIYCKIACRLATDVDTMHKALLEFNAERLFEFFVARGLAKWSRVSTMTPT